MRGQLEGQLIAGCGRREARRRSYWPDLRSQKLGSGKREAGREEQERGRKGRGGGGGRVRRENADRNAERRGADALVRQGRDGQRGCDDAVELVLVPYLAEMNMRTRAPGKTGAGVRGAPRARRAPGHMGGERAGEGMRRTSRWNMRENSSRRCTHL